MKRLAVIGDNPVALGALNFCRKAGIPHVDLVQSDDTACHPATILGSNLSRLIQAAVGDALQDVSFTPDRNQVRLARSAYLLAELPLGRFYADRYGAPHINVLVDDLQAILTSGTDTSAIVQPEAFDRSVYDLVIESTNSCAPKTLHAAQAGTVPANITWLAEGFVAWQFSTRQETHCVIYGDIDSPRDYHPMLAPYLEAALEGTGQRTHTGPNRDQIPTHTTRETLYQGQTAFIGDAVTSTLPLQPEMRYCGFEDAWVLARMLDNYEDDLSLALSEYERFRLPRHRKIAAAAALEAQRFLGKRGAQALARNLGVAFRARFLPEMAMQAIDWFYQYDCIRGFR